MSPLSNKEEDKDKEDDNGSTGTREHTGTTSESESQRDEISEKQETIMLPGAGAGEIQERDQIIIMMKPANEHEDQHEHTVALKPAAESAAATTAPSHQVGVPSYSSHSAANTDANSINANHVTYQEKETIGDYSTGTSAHERATQQSLKLNQKEEHRKEENEDEVEDDDIQKSIINQTINIQEKHHHYHHEPNQSSGRRKDSDISALSNPEQQQQCHHQHPPPLQLPPPPPSSQKLQNNENDRNLIKKLPTLSSESAPPESVNNSSSGVKMKDISSSQQYPQLDYNSIMDGVIDDDTTKIIRTKAAANNNPRRKDSDGSHSHTSGISLSIIKFDLFNTTNTALAASTTERNTFSHTSLNVSADVDVSTSGVLNTSGVSGLSGLTNNNGNNANANKTTENGGIIDAAERKGSDVSGLTAHLLDGTSTLSLGSLTKRKGSDLSSTPDIGITPPIIYHSTSTNTAATTTSANATTSSNSNKHNNVNNENSSCNNNNNNNNINFFQKTTIKKEKGDYSMNNIIAKNNRKDSEASSAASTLMNIRKESDASALSALIQDHEEEMMKQEEESLFASSNISSTTNNHAATTFRKDVRKESDASALSALIKDHEEEMMKQEETLLVSNVSRSNNATAATLRKDSFSGILSGGTFGTNNNGVGGVAIDPFENLRKLSDASTVVSFEQFHQRSPTTNKPYELKDTVGQGIGLASSNIIGLGDMKIKSLDPSMRDDASIATFENPASYNLSVLKPRFSDVLNYSSNKKNALATQGGNSSCNNMNDPPKTTIAGTATTEMSSALEHLEALGPGGKNQSDEGSVSTATLNEANQKLLVDALLHPTSRRNRAESWGGMSDISHNAAIVAASIAPPGLDAAQLPRGPSPTGLEGMMMSPRSSQGSLHSFAQNHDVIPQKIDVPTRRGSRERLDSGSSGSQAAKDNKERYFQRKRLDSIDLKSISRGRSESIDLMKSLTRDRLDSFVGRDRLDSVVTRERLDSFIARDRLDSLANLSGIFSKGRDRLDSLASLGEVSLTMSVGDLEDVAGKLEQIVNDTCLLDSNKGKQGLSIHPRNNPSGKDNLPAPTIQVDSEAVQSAVQAAMAATEGVDFLNIKPSAKGSKPISRHTPLHVSSSGLKTPSKNIITATSALNTPIPTSNQSEDELEAIRARARAAAGYVHPDKGGGMQTMQPTQKIPKKRTLAASTLSAAKRPKLPLTYRTPQNNRYPASTKAPSGALIYSTFNSSVTPKRQNYPSSAAKSITSTPGSAMSKGGQSNQKWDEMYECLVLYVKEEKLKLTKGMSNEEKSKWEWSGNVPTMFKTKDGKALGRWINNQRSAKSKGTLKKDREVKLVSTGLKWSVLTTNAWTDMMKELKIYVQEKTKDGKVWDGNVPTNYKIKTSAEGDDDDKNLGRWINRQRSLYQSGKLKEERRVELEKIGLKWAVLSTTSWQSMYDSLYSYVQTRKSIDKNNRWDGQVPANYETNEKPPKRLGRWVTRQRTAYSSKKLKPEYREKLEQLGLCWEAVNETKPIQPLHHPYLTQLHKRQDEKKPYPSVVVQRSLPSAMVSSVANATIRHTSTVKNIPPVATLRPPTASVPTLKAPTTTVKKEPLK